MGVPSIARISPGGALTGGRRVIRIWGGNFQLAPPPPPTFPAPKPNPSVQVFFGTEPAQEVRVLANSLLDVTTPIHDEGTVDITITNIQQDGTPVPGESFTASAAFVFARPELNNPSEVDRSNLTRLVAAIILELRRQILDNVEQATHTDYADEPSGANVAALAEVPGLVLSGPSLRLNRFYSLNTPRVEPGANGDSYEQRPPRTVDLVFTLIGADNITIRELDLQHECTAFFLRNTRIRMLRDPAIPNVYVEYELDLEADGDFKQVGTANNSNIHAFSGTFVVRGFDIDDADMAMRGAYDVKDVTPRASIAQPSAVTLMGQPGVTTAPPIPPGPEAAPGGTGSIQQLPPEE